MRYGVALLLAAAATIPSRQFFTANGTGAVQRKVSDKLSDTVSVLDFGAVADWNGSAGTDNGPAFLAAIAACPVIGCTVYAPAGSYYLNTSVATTQAALRIRGDGGAGWSTGAGTQIFTNGSFIAFDFGSASTTEHRGVRVEGLSVNDVSGNMLGAFRVRRMNHDTFEDVTANQFTTGYGVTLDGTGDAIILAKLDGFRCRTCKFGVVQIGAVTAMWLTPQTYVTGPSPNTGSVGVTLTGDTAMIQCAVDNHETGILISGDNHRIFGARLESNTTHIRVIGPTARRNMIVGNSFSNGAATASVQIDNSVTIFDTTVGPNEYANVAVGIVDNSPNNSNSYIYEPQQNIVKMRRVVTGVVTWEVSNQRQAGAITDIGEFKATSNGISASFRAAGDGTLSVGSTGNNNFNLMRNGTTILTALSVGAQIKSTALASLGAPADGTLAYCSDCAVATSPCTAASTGALAIRVAGAWRCQ